jgi:NAD(P)-dependent dehydrogenase (short-subunit alcohol dehydrogenase family)
MKQNTRTALVTGANKGIGFEVARQIAAGGWRVFLGARRPEAGEKAAAALAKSKGPVCFVPLDIADPASVQRAVTEIAHPTDHLDVLVNNAAILEDRDGGILDLDADVLRRTLETNVIAQLRVAQAFYPLLAKSNSARIINVSSGAGQLSDMGTWAPAYSISKAALNAVTGQLAAALQGKGIAVNSVCPGWCRTDMGGQGVPRSVEQGAETILWLATEAPQSLTGKFLRDRAEIPW